MGRLDTVAPQPIMPGVLQIGLAVWVSALVVGVCVWVPPAVGFADPSSARVVVFHVPCALVSVTAYLVATTYSISYLVRGSKHADVKAAASAGLGLLFTVLATLTGMIFAKVQWGSAWNWDPRQTSILMLMFVYAGYFALRSALPAGPVRSRIAAVYNVVACVAMVYLIFVLPRLIPGLHPTRTLISRGGLSWEYRIALLAGMIGILWLYVWLFRLRIRICELVELKRRKRIEQ